jgi:hypothetical protein
VETIELETFLNGTIERPVIVPGISIDENGDGRVGFAIGLQQRNKFNVYNDVIYLSMLKNVLDVIGFEVVVDC